MSEPTPLLLPDGGIPELITTKSQFEKALTEIANGRGPIALDAERASGYRYSARAYLIQVKREAGGLHLIDPIPLRDERELIKRFNEILAENEVILHAASQDLPCLREWGLTPKYLFDTELGARIAGLPKVGLGSLIEEFFQKVLAKEHSAVDWSKRPLDPDWLAYAALDVELLIELRNEIATQLGDKLEWAKQEFNAVLTAPPAPPKVDPWRRTSGMHKVRTREAMAIVRQLWLERDQLASALDIAPGRLLNDNAISELALHPAKTAKEFKTVLKKIGFRERWLEHIDSWLAAIKSAQSLAPDQLPQMRINGDGLPPVKNWREKHPLAYARLTHARAGLLEISEELKIPIENLCTPELIRRLCFNPTEDVAGSLTAMGARPWQVLCVAPMLKNALAQREALEAPPKGSQEVQEGQESDELRNE